MTSDARWLTVIGIGEDGLDGLSAVAREALTSADILVGGKRPLASRPTTSRRPSHQPALSATAAERNPRVSDPPPQVLHLH